MPYVYIRKYVRTLPKNDLQKKKKGLKKKWLPRKQYLAQLKKKRLNHK